MTSHHRALPKSRKNNRQVEVLKQRKDEDLFLSELATWREKAARLRNLKVDFSRLALVKIDQQASEPSSAEKPKRPLILALGMILGGMLGIFIALVRRMLRNPPAVAR
ncbi:hypothetical protein D3C78_910020 [compost metagenome]